jgi:diaminopimelate decarboxylase
MNLPLTTRINKKNHLEIGGVDLIQLAEKFGTPLYLLDEADLRDKARQYLKAFRKFYPAGKFSVAYASKALTNAAVFKIFSEEGLWLDVVSGGELFTALSVDFPAKKIFFHGNNKSDAEIKEALEAGIGYFVIDNLDEFERILKFINFSKTPHPKAYLRIVPEIKAATHSHIITGHKGSKFGLKKEEVISIIKKSKGTNLKIVGLHAHIGSQILDLKTFEILAEKMVEFLNFIYQKTGLALEGVNLGGGLGVEYLSGDRAPSIASYVKTVAAALLNSCKKFKISPPFLTVEPGRSLVAKAGVTLYRIGSIKKGGGLKIVAVDGGMSDNPRPILYNATYEAILPARPFGKKSEKITLVGKFCESGDILIKKILLPPVALGDLIMVPVTGAYNFSMASRYNRAGIPAMVLVNSGKAGLIAKRETYPDLIAGDRLPAWLKK